MFKNICITQLPQIEIKVEMVEIDNQVIKIVFKFIFYLKMHFMTILGACTLLKYYFCIKHSSKL